MKNTILGIKIHNYNKAQLCKIVTKIVSRGQKFTKIPVCIATLNPEILLKAQKDSSYQKLLQKFELNIIDGFGIVLCGFLFRGQKLHRFAGADLAETLLMAAVKNKLKIAFVINKKGLSSKEAFSFFLKEKFGEKKSKLFEIYLLDKEVDEQIKLARNTQILFVGLGAPLQEQFIQVNKEKLPNLRVAIGVGGTFDYWTNVRKRAPKLMQISGLEWFWRLLILRGYSQKKQRMKRILSAVFVFPFKFFLNNFKAVE